MTTFQCITPQFINTNVRLAVATNSTPATAVTLQHTRTIPIIFLLVADPVGSGFVASLPRPGGNATGFTPIVGSPAGK
jgi:putative ABC transport system substrate-binding protein